MRRLRIQLHAAPQKGIRVNATEDDICIRYGRFGATS